MKREDMTVGYLVEHRIASGELWEPGRIHHIFADALTVVIAVGYERYVYRYNDDVRPSTAASKESEAKYLATELERVAADGSLRCEKCDGPYVKHEPCSRWRCPSCTPECDCKVAVLSIKKAGT